MELESFELVFLRRPANAPAYDEATLERIRACSCGRDTRSQSPRI